MSAAQSVVALLLAFAFLTTGRAASFECAKASSRVEMLICSDGVLSELDDSLATEYSSLLAQSASQQEIRREQRRWLRARDGCTDADCLRETYRMRIAELAQPASVRPTIIATVPIPGFIAALDTPRGRPDLLVARVVPYHLPLATEHYGIFLMSIKNPAAPTQLAYIKIDNPIGAETTPDGSTLFVHNIVRNGFGPADGYGISIFDISDPRSPVLLTFMPGDFFETHLSYDGSTLLSQERTRPGQPRRELMVFDVRDPRSPKPRFAFAERDVSDEPIFAYGIATFPNGQDLVVAGSTGSYYHYDFRDKEKPKLLLDDCPGDCVDSGLTLRGASDRRLYVGGNGVSVYRLERDRFALLADYFWSGVVDRIHLMEKDELVLGAFGKQILLLSRQRRSFAVRERYQMSEPVGDALAPTATMIYAGLNGRLTILRRVSDSPP